MTTNSQKMIFYHLCLRIKRKRKKVTSKSMKHMLTVDSNRKKILSTVGYYRELNIDLLNERSS
jgi:hypothetical protein